MRIPSSVFAVGRYALALVVITGSVVLMSAPKKTVFTPHDKAYYASDATVNFVRPGLTLKVVSATIAQDGTISVDYKITDPNGLPLDPAGITTPGAVSVSFVCAYIPKGQTQFYSYATRAQTSPITNVTAIQAGADSGGTTKQVADGEFVYTFKTKAVGANSTAYDPTATHRVGHLRFAQPDRVRPGHELRLQHPDLDPGRRNAHQHPRRGSHGELQQVPRFAGVPWRLAHRHGSLHHVPPAADGGSRYREHRGHEGIRSQDPHGQPAAQRDCRQALPDHRFQSGGIRLVHGGSSVRSAALHILPRRCQGNGRHAVQ